MIEYSLMPTLWRQFVCIRGTVCGIGSVEGLHRADIENTQIVIQTAL